jgi:hypothetical protein
VFSADSLTTCCCCCWFPQNIRKKFPLVLGRTNQLCERLAAAGPGAAIDVDQAALRVTLDVIGLVRCATALSRGSLDLFDVNVLPKHAKCSLLISLQMDCMQHSFARFSSCLVAEGFSGWYH